MKTNRMKRIPLTMFAALSILPLPSLSFASSLEFLLQCEVKQSTEQGWKISAREVQKIDLPTVGIGEAKIQIKVTPSKSKTTLTFDATANINQIDDYRLAILSVETDTPESIVTQEGEFVELTSSLVDESIKKARALTRVEQMIYLKKLDQSLLMECGIFARK